MRVKIKNIFIPLIILIAGFLLMRIFLNMREEPQRRKPAPRPRFVQAAVVELKDTQVSIEGLGRLSSVQPVILASEVNGLLERGSIDFLPGQNFKKGDLLIKVDDRQARLDLNSAKSDLMTALATVLPEIKIDFPKEYQRWEDYFNEVKFENNIPQLPEVKNQKIKLFLSRFNVYKLYFQVRNLEIRLDKHHFYAPFDGSITAADLRAGSNVRSGSRLGQIINLNDLELSVPLPANDIAWIAENQPVTLKSSELNSEWQGKIKRIAKSIDERSQTIQVYVKITSGNQSQLYSGIYLSVSIPGKKIANSFKIPRKAIHSDHNIYLIKNGKFEMREISIAKKLTESVIVNGNISNGDTLVTELLQGVASGMPAKVRSMKKSGANHE